jgi:heme-degrading monooxygenase HmoA
MPYMLVRHRVADFDTWKRVFDSHAEAQRQSGLHTRHVLRNMEDPSEVFILLEVTDMEGARTFVNAPEAYEAKDESGVLDEPDAYWLE